MNLWNRTFRRHPVPKLKERFEPFIINCSSSCSNNGRIKSGGTNPSRINVNMVLSSILDTIASQSRMCALHMYNVLYIYSFRTQSSKRKIRGRKPLSPPLFPPPYHHAYILLHPSIPRETLGVRPRKGA